MKKRPIYARIMRPMLLFVVLEVILLVCGILGQGMLKDISENSRKVMEEKVSSRKEYLENSMTGSWMNLSSMVNSVNHITDSMLSAKKVSLNDFRSASKSSPLLQAVAPKLISMMRGNHVTGAFIILNTENLSKDAEHGVFRDKTGLYIRDQNPLSQYSETNNDLLVERGPISVVQELGLAADSNWTVNFNFDKNGQEYYDFLYTTFQTAYEQADKQQWQDLGYWSRPYRLNGGDNLVIAYAVPLILPDGTVYGVAGIDITLNYLKTQIPYSSLDGSGRGGYFIGVTQKEENCFDRIIGGDNLGLFVNAQQEKIRIDPNLYHIETAPLKLYPSNTPYSDMQWVLIGVVRKQDLNRFVNTMIRNLLVALVMTLIISVIGSIGIGTRIAKPVSNAAKEMSGLNPRKSVSISETGIREFDEMIGILTKLSQDVSENDRKITRIIHMVSVGIAAFEIDYSSNTLFVTDGFFALFGEPQLDKEEMTAAMFREKINQFQKYYYSRDVSANSYCYAVPQGDKIRYIELKYQEDRTNTYGVIEDVTQKVLDRKKLIYQRDHDALTGLKNRRSFRNALSDLFVNHPEKIYSAAMVMMDLDNLKFVNDQYGHDAGDRYIIAMAEGLRSNLPKSAIYARNSGDEFNAFIYGYQSEEEIRGLLRDLEENLRKISIPLSENGQQFLSVSGGYCWYGKNSINYEELLQQADQAMYKAKREDKGSFQEFDN